MYCPYLWKSQCILPDNKVTPCCHSSGNQEWNQIDYTQGITSAVYKQAREQLQKGEWPTVCSVCQNDEEKNIKSARQRSLEIFHNQTHNVELEYLDVKFNNMCNLSCRMCNPSSSSKLENLYKTKSREMLPSFLQNYYMVDFKTSTEEEFKKLGYTKKCIENGLKHLKVTGGEPFASASFLEILNWCNENNYSDNLGLSIITNGTKYNKSLLNKLVKFKYVSVSVSLDGTENIYNYIRQGSNWDKLQKNLNLFDSFFNDKKDKLRFHNNTIHVAVVLQFFNLFDIGNIIAWCSKRGYRPKIDTNLKPIDSELSIKYLPWDLKKSAINDLEKLLHQYKNQEWYSSQLEKVLNFIKSTKKNHDSRKNLELKNTILKQDKLYKTNYKNYLDQRQIDFLKNV